MKVNCLDHLVLTVADIEATCVFYTRVLGMERRDRNGRTSLHFGVQKVNLHQKGHEFEPKAHLPVPGSADLCFISELPIDDVCVHLATCSIDIVEGPVQRGGAAGPMQSVYVRDPDQNLIEISDYGK